VYDWTKSGNDRRRLVVVASSHVLAAAAPAAMSEALTVGITTYSVYVPRCRLDLSLIARAWGTAQAAGEIAVANYDEDALTMARQFTTVTWSPVNNSIVPYSHCPS
jgi:hypothetical protein